MIKFEKVNKFYLGDYLLKDVSWHMKPGEKVGLIGSNGTGKTTQLRMICKTEEFDAGQIIVAPDITIGYLSQEPLVTPENTLNQELYSVFKDVLKAENDIKLFQKEISTLPEGDQLQNRLKNLSELQEFFEMKEGYSIHARIGQVISGLGFSEEDRERLIKTFSGGWQMRISIAKLLLESPDLLLLDEPTNHLDIKAIEWLESYLSSYKGGYIIVSHDREFLEKTVERIIEMEGATANLFWGPYSKYQKEKEFRYEQQLAAYIKQQEKIAKDKAFIEKFRANASRSSQAKSREKQLEKIELIAEPKKIKQVKFQFPVNIKSGEEVLKISSLYKAFGENELFNDLNLEIRSGEKIGLIGGNGTGKTTLLKMILNTDKAYQGKIKYGNLVKTIYFSQHEARGLSGERTAFEELHNSAPRYTNEQVRAALGRFGLSGDSVFKTLSSLSGGEKARIALAKMLMAGANFLLFDEPTNHLDIPAKEALEEALNSFEGTVIAISHDRKFIDNFANKIFKIENKNITVYYGNYSYYKTKETQQRALQEKNQTFQKPEKKKVKTVTEAIKVELPKKVSPKSIEKQVIKYEKEITLLEETIKTVESKLADPEFYQRSPEAFMIETEKLETLKQQLEDLTEKCLELLDLQEQLVN